MRMGSIVSVGFDGDEGVLIDSDGEEYRISRKTLNNMLQDHGNLTGRTIYKEYDSTTISPGWITVIL